jgi:hypothetical protein
MEKKGMVDDADAHADGMYMWHVGELQVQRPPQIGSCSDLYRLPVISLVHMCTCASTMPATLAALLG